MEVWGMRRIQSALAAMATVLAVATTSARWSADIGPAFVPGEASSTIQPAVTLLRAPRFRLPGPADSNSPAAWSIVDGMPRFAVMTSVAGAPSISTGAALTQLGAPTFTPIEGSIGGVWMEAVVVDPDGTWYGFYHNELASEICRDTTKMTPHIGAARSENEGASWQNLGIVLETPPQAVDCETRNRYFTGGVGDFSVILDPQSQYLYLFYSQYVRKLRAQGIGVARLAWADRDAPTGRVLVWRDDVWSPARSVGSDEAGDPVRWSYPIGTPVYRADESWHDDDDVVDAFWGPSVHWNTYLERYVMLLNRASDVEWTNEGIYAAFTSALDSPRDWSTPTRILEGGRWYPQVIGLEPGAGTDKLAGRVARFFLSGESDHLIEFIRPDELQPPRK
jgi:hypothetical protein